MISDYYYPQMIHISLTGVKGEMAVDWISSCNETTPSYGTQYTVTFYIIQIFIRPTPGVSKDNLNY